MLDHLREIWCSGDEKMYDYVLNWLSFIVQRPGEKTKVALCLKSEEGAGKGCILKLIEQIVSPEYYLATSNMKYILGNFNSIMEGKVLIDLDEASWGGRRSDANALKEKITEEKQEIEKKGKRPIHNPRWCQLHHHNKQ